jgi:ABC-2 type transport system permease protein
LRTLDIAIKDLLRSVRSVSFLAFGFVVPLLVSGIFYFAFGGVGATEGFDVPQTRVLLANQDRGQEGFSAGQMLEQFLKSEDLANLLAVTDATDAAGARAAIDRQEADVAVIIPAGFTAAVFDPEGRAAVELYQDPTLTLGPGVVGGIIRQFVDGFAGSKIAVEVASAHLAEHSTTLDAGTAQKIVAQYSGWVAALGEGQEAGTSALVQVRSLSSGKEKSAGVQSSIIGLIMAGMMVFYVFFTGAASAQSLLQEEEAGTLPRLLTTPTALSSVLGGRLIASLVTLVLQVAVLLVISALVFDIGWGRLIPLSVVTLGLVLLAASFGLFVTSLLKSTRQAGIVYGGVLTILGMVGMIGIFTAGVPGASAGAFATISLLTPQGWAVRGYELLLQNGAIGEVMPYTAVMLGLSVAFFTIGVLRFRRRFA